MKLKMVVSMFIFLTSIFLLFPITSKAQEILFNDDFEQDRSSQWTQITGDWQRKIVGNSMRYGLSINTGSSMAEVQGGNFNWTNYEFSFDIFPISGIDRNIFFRVNSQRSTVVPRLNLPVGYGLHMYPDHIWLQKFATNEYTEPVSLPITLPNNSVTHFTIRLVENNIKVFINSNPAPIINYTDAVNPVLSGRIGLVVTTGSSLSEVWFDNVKVTSIDSPLPQLKVIKEFVQDNGGVDKIEAFTLKVGDTVVKSNETNSFSPGTYTISEAGPSGYISTYSGNCNSNGQITLQAGDSIKTCVITNDDIAPRVTITKNITNNIEHMDPNNFRVSLGGNYITSGSTVEVMANTPMSINETGIANYDFVSITGTDCPTQLGEEIILYPGQNLSCTITNNYIAPPTPTPIPVTKVLVIPGLGASWNVDALINCKDSGYGGGWTLAPYAKDVYQNLLSNLAAKNWNAIPFYYDWRKDVRDNSSLLKDLINSSVSGDEKVNLVGHSMGGLIGRNYLESQSGGKASKFLAVGTPNQGSALAYPAVINNEVWTNNLVQKIAATLLFNHCGAPTSFKNLLPTYDYLRDNRTKQLKDVSQMKTKNNYLPTSFVSDFWGVKVGTLAGTGQQTLKIINVVKDSKWPDGKPVGKENVNEGDGTVLASSAQIAGASSNETINQSHSGIIASDEGVDKILRFLGSPGINDPAYSEPKSALVLVGYPGNFWITDKNGDVTQSEDGMIAIMDPKDGDYQLQINPTLNTTTFIVGQFLANGQSEYNEYRIRGLNLDPKIIEFNSKHTNKNPLHEIKEYKHPIFPRIWFNFWRFWNKLRK